MSAPASNRVLVSLLIESGLQTLASFDLDALKDPRLGSLSFEGLWSPLSLTQHVLKNFGGVMGGTPGLDVKEIAQKVQDLNKTLQLIPNFRLAPDVGEAAAAYNAPVERQKIIDAVESQCHALLRLTWIPALQAQLDAQDTWLKDVDVALAKASADEHDQKMSVMLATAQKLITDLKAAASEQAAMAFAKTFDEAAKKHRRGATYWLLGTILCATSTLGFGVATMFLSGPTETNVLGLVHYIGGRIIVLTVLFYLTGLFGRNFRASQHNTISNEHRAVSLRTFQLFAEGTADPETKSAILLRAAEAAFRSAGTGYQAADAEPPPNATIVEILRKVSDKSDAKKD